MQWATHYRLVRREWVVRLAAQPTIGSVMALAGLLTLVACGTTYDRGAEAANNLVAEFGVDASQNRRATTSEIRLGRQFQNTSFAKTIREAVLSFPTLASQQFQMDGAAARMDGLIGSLRPQFSTGLSAGQDLLGDGGGPTTDARITMRQLIFDGAATRNQITLTRVNQRQLGFEMEALLSSLSRQMALAGLELWRQSELLRLAEEDVAAHQEFVSQTQERAAGGVVAESDLLSARSRLANARANLARAGSALAQAEASYVELIGGLPAEIRKPPPPPTMGPALARERIGTSSQMVIARLRVAEARSRRDVVMSRRYPGVFLQVSGTRDDVLGDDAENDVFAGFSVNYDIASGGQQRAREREAESQLSAAESRLEEVERQLRRALEVALANREAIVFETQAAADAVQFNQASLAAVRDQFGIGRRSIVNILDAQRDLTAARTREIAVQASQIEAELAILELTGDLAEVFGIEYDPLAETTLSPNNRIVVPGAQSRASGGGAAERVER